MLVVVAVDMHGLGVFYKKEFEGGLSRRMAVFQSVNKLTCLSFLSSMVMYIRTIICCCDALG